MFRRYEIQIEVQNKCFLDCKHCSSVAMRDSQNKEFMEKEIINFLNIFKGDVFLYFTGGEPLFNLNIIKKIRKVHSVYPNINIGLYTCGIVKNNNIFSPISIDLAKSMKNAGVKECYLSLYHQDDKIHDYITNMEGSLSITKKSIKNLLNSEIDVKIHLVINRYNVYTLIKTLEEIIKLGVKEVRLLRMVKTGSAVENWEDIGVSDDKQNKAIIEILREKNKFSTKITVSGYPEVFPCRPFDDSIKCQSGINVLYITQKGEVYPCACTKGDFNFCIGKINDLKKIENYIYEIANVNYHENCLNSIKNGE